MLKVELHAHTDGDPADRIPHSTRQLIDRAAELGYGGLAVTLHDRYFDPAEDASYARDRGVVLLPGIERTIAGRHLLLVNFPRACETVRNFREVQQLKERSRGLVVAPHPFYPVPSALRSVLDSLGALIDAVEYNAMYTTWLNFNTRAAAWAREHGKPLVGNSDLHLLEQMGTTFSLVDAPPDPDAICEAIRAGRVRLCTTPLPSIQAARLFLWMSMGGLTGRTLRAARGSPS